MTRNNMVFYFSLTSCTALQSAATIIEFVYESNVANEFVKVVILALLRGDSSSSMMQLVNCDRSYTN